MADLQQQEGTAEKLAVLTHSVDALREQVACLSGAIRGNGGPGIQTNLAVVQHRLTALENFERQVISAKRWACLGAIGFGASMIAEFVTGLSG